eukprot:CAMPEP_0170493200 /NCGR_PEP_ID=MMETSP0208-20121228/13512_1 /TAXON_ID=197538 /ORGANISM="Strombidium inclinatum, Strain S3" /LENGTH=192 /DNA_ID=CAMNT_0010769091 /DNA_START=6 /DNA_END=584 /DNA_ORIENTATION=-
MAHFLKGKFKGFYPAGTSQCVKDVFRFKKTSEGKLLLEVTRRDMESYFGRFWRYESSKINFHPVDESQPRLGGKVSVKSFVVDFQTLTLGFQNQYGIYSDDFVAYGTFDKSVGNPLDDEEVLLKVVQDGETDAIEDKTSFKFENNEVTFAKEVNAEKSDAETNHSVPSTQLDRQIKQSWTESMFYGIGNQSM